MTGECCGGSCGESDPIQVNSELKMKATAALREEVESDLEAEDASLAKLLESDREESEGDEEVEDYEEQV